MEIDKCIKERRSIRDFLDKEISWENITKILDAGRHAPSSGNIQNWRFIVVKSKGQKEKIAEACNQPFVKKANYLIAVCSEQDRIKNLYGNRGKDFYSMQNCACAAQNMLLKAYSLGIGSCWVGAFNDEKISRILELKDNLIPCVIIALGYTKEKGKAKRNELENTVFFETYGNKQRKIYS